MTRMRPTFPLWVAESLRARRTALAVTACTLAAFAALPSLASAADPVVQTPVLPQAPIDPVVQTPVLPKVPIPAVGPLPLSIEVVPDEPGGPTPTGSISLSSVLGLVFARPVSNTAELALTATALAATQQKPTLTYSGDDNYERSDPVAVRFLGGN